MRYMRILSLIIVCAIVLCGCEMTQIPEDKENVKKTYALITKSQGNPYNDLAAQGFQEVITREGGNCVIASPEEATAEAQIFLIRSLISQQVDSISIAANDTDALQDALREAMENGIKVSTLDSNTNAASRMTFVNQASTSKIGQVLMDAVYDLAGGWEQWAILSTTSQAANQNSWIYEMQSTMEKDKYNRLDLVSIVYGKDDYELSMEKARELLEEFPDLKVICAPTTVGIEAVAKVLKEKEDTKVKVTGLGLPSKMASYIMDENSVCPYMYLWDPIDLGRLSAYVSIALVEDEITGAVGESFEAGELGTYMILYCEDGGSQVIVAPPLKFDKQNIADWKELF